MARRTRARPAGRAAGEGVSATSAWCSHRSRCVGSQQAAVASDTRSPKTSAPCSGIQKTRSSERCERDLDALRQARRPSRRSAPRALPTSAGARRPSRARAPAARHARRPGRAPGRTGRGPPSGRAGRSGRPRPAPRSRRSRPPAPSRPARRPPASTPGWRAVHHHRPVATSRIRMSLYPGSARALTPKEAP